jgi:hypothetical protein
MNDHTYFDCKHPLESRAEDPMGGLWCIRCDRVIKMPPSEALDSIGWPRTTEGKTEVQK